MPEREKPVRSEFIATRAVIDRQLELVDENENPIERMLKRDELLELRDELELAGGESLSAKDVLTP